MLLKNIKLFLHILCYCTCEEVFTIQNRYNKMFTTYSKKVALAKLYETDFDVHIKTRCSFDHNNFIAERFSLSRVLL